LRTGAVDPIDRVYRYLKPANIGVTPDGEVNVLDFGLTKMLEQE
jgi:hypothetical protein